MVLRKNSGVTRGNNSPPLNTDPNLRDLIPLTTVTGLHRVIDFWKPFDPGDLWHTWKNTHEHLNIPPTVDL
jgi:hypothetical protein